MVVIPKMYYGYKILLLTYKSHQAVAHQCLPRYPLVHTYLEPLFYYVTL